MKAPQKRDAGTRRGDHRRKINFLRLVDQVLAFQGLLPRLLGQRGRLDVERVDGTVIFTLLRRQQGRLAAFFRRRPFTYFAEVEVAMELPGAPQAVLF